MYAYHILSSGYFPVEMTVSQWSSRRLDGSHSHWNPSATARHLGKLVSNFYLFFFKMAPWCFIWFHGSPPPPRANSPGGSPWDRCGMCCRNICATVWTSYWFHIMVPFSHLYIYIYTYAVYKYIYIYIWGAVNMFSFFNAFFWKRSWEQVWSGPASRSLRFWRGSHHVWKLEDFDATCTIWHLAWSPFLYQVQEATGTRFRTTTKLWLSKKWATNHISHVL